MLETKGCVFSELPFRGKVDALELYVRVWWSACQSKFDTEIGVA